MLKTDFLVIGSGLAGLSFALNAAEYGKVIIITKAAEEESNTKYAQGGIATATSFPDTDEKHVQDTLICGDGLCNEKIVRLVVEKSHERIKELISWGAEFDRTASGEFDLAREGGHSEKRVLHYKDFTGLEIERKLITKVNAHPNIEVLTHYFAIDLITQHHLGKEVKRSTPGIECYGAYILDIKTGKVKTLLSRITLMAAGGAGQVYKNTTNPVIATGDGIAMSYRAMAKVNNMEFVQFHPTALFKPGVNPSFLITEAIRGAGGILRNKAGKDFMPEYDKRASLAPRDIVARAIDSEMKKSGDEFVYLDCTGILKKTFKEHFPTILAKCKEMSINPAKDYIPVAPAAHYFCGGIVTDEHGRTSITNLYAAGECATTGLHGANRLASNSLLEALVFSNQAFQHSCKQLDKIHLKKEVPEWEPGRKVPGEMVLITQSLKELKEIMTNYVGIFRSDMRLQRAQNRTRLLYEETEELYQKWVLTPQICELRNMINIGYLIIKAAIARSENRGLHFNVDN
ncbi:MAG: L-aspartate oxidase [Bacteroidia bacterium]|nr:L-aspartate oxidase [Bacteroidia bacterium]